MNRVINFVAGSSKIKVTSINHIFKETIFTIMPSTHIYIYIYIYITRVNEIHGYSIMTNIVVHLHFSFH